MKRFLALFLAAILLLSLAAGLSACKEETDGPTPSSSKDEPGEQTPSSGKDADLALVVADKFGDRSFYDSAKEGVDRLVEDQNLRAVYIECNGTDHDSQMRNAADRADIVVCVGWEFYEIETTAPDYPEVKWIWIDNATGSPVSNVLNITYAQNEGSFLAGYVAAAMSESGVIGAVGGEDAATINDFIVGYQQGAEYYATESGKQIKVVTNYANTYDDPAVGKDCAIALNDEGADVIFQIASATGDGVFEAAKERGFYAIGVDSDQKFIDEDVIICSMKKEVGNSIYDAVTEFLRGDTAKLGTTWVADMSNGYVGLGYGEPNAKQQIPDELKAAAAALAEKIVSGEITVDTTR